MKPSHAQKPQPDFDQLMAAITRRYHSERITMAELQVDPEIMEAKLGRPVKNLADYVSFWEMTGYDYSLLSFADNHFRIISIRLKLVVRAKTSFAIHIRLAPALVGRLM